jgi:methylmalonyl-CoA mutase
MTVSDLPLASEFPPATREQWLKLVEATLKGAPFDKKLVSRTYDGLKIEPLYQRVADAQPLAARAAAAPWQIMARVDHPDPAEANKLLLEDLENGATGLTLVCAGSIGSYGFGLEPSQAAIEQVLEGVLLDGVAIEFSLTREAKDLPLLVAGLAERRGLSASSVDLRASFDPLGLMAAGASAPAPWSAIAPVFATMVGDLNARGLRGPFAVADGRVIHNAGGSEAQELAFTLGNAVAYLRALEAGGIALDAARSLIFFRLSADADQFMTMAKFRAIRKLWARVEEACGLAPKPAFVSAETAWRMMTRRDPYVNMLRTTIAAFSAGLGGANAVSVLPYTNAMGLPDAFARRNARNTQLILLEESNLGKVGDPAAGSGGIEDLTDQLCRTAWTLFQEIEAAGGAAAAIEKGLIQTKVAATRAEREKAVATRKDPITGTSEFPHIGEAAVSVLVATPLPNPPPQGGREQSELAALLPIRLAEPFEQLRDASDAIVKTTGARPKVFLATLGKPADSIARATFAKNFFEAGGIEAVEGAADAAAFKKSGASLACLCSSDEVYAADAAGAAKTLASAGAKHIYLAGRPDELAATLDKAGVKSFVYAGCDVLATLKAAHNILG